MPFTFKGGVHVDEHKNTRRSQIRRMPVPHEVVIPMNQHIGAPCQPVVAAGDPVTRGQVIGTVQGALGCPVHASVSGTVKEISYINDAQGRKIQSVVIESDGENTLCPDLKPFERPLTEASADEIVQVIRESGICGMGGAGFPAYAKLQGAIGKAEKLIINCAECEPFICANHRLLLENPASVINGAKILLKALGIADAVIAIEDNKLDAANKLEELLADDDMIKVAVLKTKYPQGDERQLINVIMGKQLPVGKLPADAGCVVFNAETCSAVYNAFAHGLPLVERIVTVDGDAVAMPKNVLVPIGTKISDLVEFCGGFKKELKKVINGGPMMGRALHDLDAPVTKTTSAVLAFSARFAKTPSSHYQCIRCGKCVQACPMNLMPLYFAAFGAKDNLEKCMEFDIMDCVECGSCTYICPGRVPIVQQIQIAKGKIREEQAAAKAAAQAARKETEQ